MFDILTKSSPSQSKRAAELGFEREYEVKVFINMFSNSSFTMSYSSQYICNTGMFMNKKLSSLMITVQKRRKKKKRHFYYIFTICINSKSAL